MIFNKEVIEDIKQKSGLLFDKTNDYALLSVQISEATNRTIGVTTLKRLFCYIRDAHKASEYTLNTIAIYLGYDSWKSYSSAKSLVSEWGYKDDTVYVHKLNIGQVITIKYLDRIVKFSVMEKDCQKILKVVTAENSSLMPNDLLWVYRIRNGEKLEAEKILRGDIIGNYRSNGEVSVIEIK